MNMQDQRPVSQPGTRRGFSLIELLITMAVIAIVIAIIVPTLGGARNTAKAAATQSQLTEIGNAAQQYYTDKQRLPGYFSAREMGDSENEMRGFTAMQNVMLDLAGGFPTPTGGGTGLGTADNFLEVGPTSSQTVEIDPQLIGTREAGGGYYTPDENKFRPQDASGAGEIAASVDDHEALPAVVDSFGTPILAWQKDRTAIQPIMEPEDFAQPTSGAADMPSARYYLASNAGLLNTSKLGKRGKSVALVSGREHSIIGDDVMDDDRINRLMVLLGSPTVPNKDNPLLPSGTRGDLVFHSGGINALYMGSEERGGRTGVEFRQSFYSGDSGTTRLTDSNDKVISRDLLEEFDDMIESVGN